MAVSVPTFICQQYVSNTCLVSAKCCEYFVLYKYSCFLVLSMPYTVDIRHCRLSLLLCTSVRHLWACNVEWEHCKFKVDRNIPRRVTDVMSVCIVLRPTKGHECRCFTVHITQDGRGMGHGVSSDPLLGLIILFQLQCDKQAVVKLRLKKFSIATSTSCLCCVYFRNWWP